MHMLTNKLTIPPMLFFCAVRLSCQQCMSRTRRNLKWLDALFAATGVALDTKDSFYHVRDFALQLSK